MLSDLELITLMVSAVHLIGIISAIDALYWSPSSESALAWGISLIAFPYGALPLYWLFGRIRFRGYQELINRWNEAHADDIAVQRDKVRRFIAKSVPLGRSTERAFEFIARSEFTDGNDVQLLTDGRSTINQLFSAFRAARSYIFVQFYIIRDDGIGQEFKTLLMERAKAGVKVFLLYDELGSNRLSRTYLRELRNAGVEAHPFGTRQGFGNFLQINFRNHRKVAVIDGQVAFVGGFNLGDEYLGRNKRFGPWRDTHARLTGPAVLSIQEMFLADWYWATRTQPELTWGSPVTTGTIRALPLATGPADEQERCTLFFLEAINSATNRLWIGSPYFVPSAAIIQALELAQLRGVDVRILLPNKPDHILVWLASFSYIPQLAQHGIKFLRYQDGFLHEKVMLVDDNLAVVGTANLDNRSLRLNFEIMLLVADKSFCKKVEEMFEQDFKRSLPERLKNFGDLPLATRLCAKFARLFSPIL